MRASIDLGTNTCLLLIENKGQVVHDQSEIVRLGQDLAQKGEFQPEAMVRTLACLKNYYQVCQKHGIDPKTVLAVATASARDSRNTESFFQEIKKQTGFVFRTLSGDQEAKATFLGAALPGIQTKEMLVMDIGGGSTELVTEAGGKSINIGAVKITETFLKSDPVTDDEFWKAEDAIEDALKEFDSFQTQFQNKRLVAVAGTATTLAQVHVASIAFDAEKINSTVLTVGDLHRWVEELKWRTVAERRQMLGMEIKRADVLLGGAMIFWKVMQKFKIQKARISTRGLRFGVFELSLD